MEKKSKISIFLTISLILIICGPLGWYFLNMFESEAPTIQLDPLPEFVNEATSFRLSVTDKDRGLQKLRVSVRQEGRESILLEEEFPFQGLINADGTRHYSTEFRVDTLRLNQGRVQLQIHARDYSKRQGGDGNLGFLEHNMVVDTIPPAVRPISRLHYVNIGGSGLVVYQGSSDMVRSGVLVDELFFPGFPANPGVRDGPHVCYFAIPLDANRNTKVVIWAEDQAGNTSETQFYCRIRRKTFPTDRINVTDSFVDRISPYFASYLANVNGDPIARFLKINNELREINDRTFYEMRTKTRPERLWEGVWLRLRNSANRAGFGDKRIYFYDGKEIDQQTHMGVDLASLANADVEAANRGVVLYTGDVGIYGLTVVLDHGQGLASSYSHLSRIDVQVGQEVAKGDVIGTTGQTGLAIGDHLHFGVMVGGLFVNPIEWWDPNWIQDNVEGKLNLIQTPAQPRRGDEGSAPGSE